MKTETKKYVLPAIILSMIVTAFMFYAFMVGMRPVSASAPIYESYLSTTSSSVLASGSVSKVLCTGNCQFGSIVVSQPGTAGYVRVWNATSTATSTYATTDTATSSSVTVGVAISKVSGASDAFGTLVYDVAMNKGIVVETSTGFDGEYQITYKR
jgi:hypothetical protein